MPRIIDREINRILATSSYEDVAKFLLQEAILRLGKEDYYLLEIEYYDLDDPYTHRDSQQYIPDRWYFHRRGGSFKGVDITCYHGSFLIRAVQNVKTKEITEGPSLCVDLILDKVGCYHVNDLRSKYIRPSQMNTNLRLIRSSSRQETILRARRIGLHFSEEREDYWQVKDRFLTKPKLLKKGRKILMEDNT